MAIEGLCVRQEVPEIPALSKQLRSGQPDVAEAVDVTIEAYHALGFTPEVDQATRSLTTEFTKLAELGYDGRLYVEPPSSVSFDQIIEAAEGKRAAEVAPIYRYPNLWVPGAEKQSYTQEELDAAATEAVARLAVFNAGETSGIDPLLHFLGLPYDTMNNRAAEPSPLNQLEALELIEGDFANQHPAAFIKSLGHRAVATLVLMDRIRGVEKVDPRSPEFVLNQGWMRIHVLGRRKVDGDSYVGGVSSYEGRLKLGRSLGDANDDYGVGLSVGLNELEPQSS